ncbi:MAG: multidrug efflux SMR transporter [Propionivibrio sp.]
MSIPTHWLLLSAAIGSEVLATSALRLADGFTRPLPSLVSLLGYVSSFYCRSLALRSVPLGIAYAIWCGIGLLLISLVGTVLYKQLLDWPAILGIALIGSGVLVISLFSSTMPH